MAPTASPQEQARLLDLQTVDTTVLQVRRKRSELPAIAAVRDLEVASGAVDYKIVAATTEVSDRTLDLRKAENDVEQVVNRATRDRERMDSGAGSAKDLEGLARELESLAKRQSELEDVELEAMQALEEAQAALDALKSDRERITAELDAARAELAERTSQLDAQEADLLAERALLSGGLPADLIALYDKLRADLGGIGAAMLHRGACQGCHLTLDATEIGRIRGLPEDSVARCAECRRILVRTGESGL